ncbi:MAG: response regulator [Dehalococcoidia bacterium]
MADSGIPPGASESPGHVAPILVVEDDPDIRAAVALALEDDGLPYVLASDGGEALARLDELQPALVLLDLNLPVVDGEAVAAFAHNRYGRDIPIVVVSATAHMNARPWRIGPRAYLHKPFDVDELLRTVHRLIGDV